MSKVSLCNRALRRVGEQTITSLDDISKNAKLCNELYQQVMDDVLRSHNWNCATFRAELAESSSDPSFGWTNSFTLPNDPYCLRVIRMEDPTMDFVVEGREVLTDDSQCKIVYIGRVQNPDNLDALCKKVFILSLAVEIAYTLVEQNTILNGLYEQLKDAWREARSMDSHEGTPMQDDQSDWIDARRQSLGFGVYTNNVR